MKKVLVTGFASVVIATAWFGTGGKNSEALESNNVKNNKVVVFTALDENLKDNGTISDGIHNTSMILNDSLEHASSFSEIKGIENIEIYMNGVIELAEERNAAQLIKDRLNQSNQLIQQAISEQDINKLHQADKILLDLDLEFNEGVSL
ncbi:hypothetical protein [Bacillus marasmi]|uniref:hypothetical protein n=1 Tax=Bacillus marasmi TaxID=1926279 RepID=UPI0011CA3FFA|nr:hypothetical protein [Bacillus marasmi]